MIKSKTIRIGAIISVFLALMIVLTQIPIINFGNPIELNVLAADTDPNNNGNTIVYDGGSYNLDFFTVTGLEGNPLEFSYESVENVSRYQNAIAVKANSLKPYGWLEMDAINDVNNNYIANAIGVAMYVKLPKTTEAKVNFRMVNTTESGVWKRWNSLPSNVKVTYVDPDDPTNHIVKYEIPGTSMPGFEGFIFIEFDQMTWAATQTDANKWTKNNVIVNNGAEGETRIAISPFWNNTSANGETFYFDNIGFYADINGYINFINKYALGTQVVIGDNIMDNGVFINRDLRNYYYHNGSEWVNTGTQVQLSDFNPTKVTDSIIRTAHKITMPNQTVDGNIGYLPKASDVSISINKAYGVALYVELPEDAEGSFQFEPIVMNKNDNGTIAVAGMGGTAGCKTVYVHLDGTVETVTDRYPGSGMAGFKGFMFIYGEQTYNSTANNNNWAAFKNAVNQGNGRVAFQLSGWRDASFYGKEYIIGAVGFFSDVQAYLDVVKKNYIIPTAEGLDINSDVIGFSGADAFESVASNDYGFRTDMVATTEVALEKADENSTAFGSSVAFWNTAAGGTGGALFPLPSLKHESTGDTMSIYEYSLSDSTGLAFYIKIPDRIQTNMFVDIIDSRLDGFNGTYFAATPISYADITYYPIDGEPFKSQPNEVILENKQGFEGFVFIPFTEFSHPHSNTPLYDENGNKTQWIDGIQNEFLSVRFRPFVYLDGGDVENSSDIGKKFYVSNIGFYSSPEGYIAHAKETIDAKFDLKLDDRDSEDEKTAASLGVLDYVDRETGKLPLGDKTSEDGKDVHIIKWYDKDEVNLGRGTQSITDFTIGRDYTKDFKADFFVKSTLEPHAQAKSGSTAGRTNVRLIGAIDDEFTYPNGDFRYNKVGFVVSTKGDPTASGTQNIKSLATSYIWKGLYALTKVQTPKDVYKNDAFAEYFFAYDVNNVPVGTELYVRAFIEKYGSNGEAVNNPARVFGKLAKIAVKANNELEITYP